jgi:hypothetical protein
MLSTLLRVLFLQTSANTSVGASTEGGIGFQFRQIKADTKQRVQLISFCVLAISLKSTKYASRRYINGSELLPVTWATARRVLLLITGSILSKTQPQRCELVELVHFCRCAISFHLPNSGLNV